MFLSPARGRSLIVAGLLLAMSSPAFADPLSGAALYADVRRYESFGPHRYGSPGAERALAWIAGRAGERRLKVPLAALLSLARQYDFEAATLRVDGARHARAMPQWWIPEGRAAFALTAPIAASHSGPHPTALCALPFRSTAAPISPPSMSPPSKAFARRPAAVLLTSSIRAARSSPTTSIRRAGPGRCRYPGSCQGPACPISRTVRSAGDGVATWRLSARVPGRNSWAGWIAEKDAGLWFRRR